MTAPALCDGPATLDRTSLHAIESAQFLARAPDGD
jgi:hypothetical protein